MLDNVLLVHMNGRVYEPRTGRFLSADPHVDGAATTQGWNRYAYVHGRVLSARDPSGFALEEVIFLFSRWASSGGSGGGAVTVGSASAEPREAEVLIGPDGVETAFVPGTRMRAGGRGGMAPIAPTTSSQSERPIEPEKPSPRQQCINEHYGDSYDRAWDISPLSVSSIFIDGGTEYLEDKLSQQGNRNLYGNARQYEIGKRQIRTLAQFRTFNAVMAIAGAGAAGYIAGANITCTIFQSN